MRKTFAATLAVWFVATGVRAGDFSSRRVYFVGRDGTAVVMNHKPEPEVLAVRQGAPVLDPEGVSRSRLPIRGDADGRAGFAFSWREGYYQMIQGKFSLLPSGERVGIPGSAGQTPSRVP